MMKKLLLLVLIYGWCSWPSETRGSEITTLAPDSSITVKGTVFIDKNRNGRFDPEENGKGQVLLSNGSKVVTTNVNGAYEIKINPNQLVFPLLPNGFLFHDDTTWWFSSRRYGSTTTSGSAANRMIQNINFPLYKEQLSDTFKVLAIGDVQVGDKTEVDYAARTIFPELVNRSDYDFSIFMGDLVNDEPHLMKPLKSMMKQLQKPAWTIYGNHDRNFEGDNQALSYNRHFGPENYAFFKHNILFVGLNSIYPKGKYGYEGMYSETELAFVTNILKHISRDQLVVINQHIPLRWMKNREALKALVEEQEKVLVLSAHTHTVFQEFYGDPSDRIHEINVGATSGHWWTGQKDWKGNPLSLMKDGTPRGYFEITFADNDYEIAYKGVGLPEDSQMSMWFGENREEVVQEIGPDNRQIYINVFAGSAETKVRIRIDDSEWLNLQKVNEPDPFIGRIKLLQDEDLYPNQLSRKSPYLRSSSRHLWKGSIPEEVNPGMHKIEVSARDSMGLNAKETTWFWVK